MKKMSLRLRIAILTSILIALTSLTMNFFMNKTAYFYIDSLGGYVDKMENKETFVVMLSQTYCNACLSFFLETDDYTEEIGLTLWDIILDDESTSEEENLKLTNEKFGHFSATPSIYYIAKAEVKDSLCSD